MVANKHGYVYEGSILKRWKYIYSDAHTYILNQLGDSLLEATCPTQSNTHGYSLPRRNTKYIQRRTVDTGNYFSTFCRGLRQKIGRRNRMALAFSFIEIFLTFCCARLFGLNGHPSLNPNGPTESGWKKMSLRLQKSTCVDFSPLQASGGPWPRFVQAQVHRH